MQVTFWKVNKRINSTKLPTENGITISALYFKDITDINKPSIQVSAINMNDGYNYAMIGNKYYYVIAVESMVKSVWRVDLQIDLLATYKQNILATTAFVSRASNGYNPYIVDDFNTVSTKINKTVLQASENGFYETGEGCYILEVNNSLTNAIYGGFNGAYILTYQQMNQIASKLMTDQGLIDELKKIFQSPIDSVINCQWLPINYDVACAQTGGITTNVWLGAYDTGISAYLVGNNMIETQYDFDLSTFISDNYLRNPKYIDILLCLPYVGTVAIDTKQMIEASDNTTESKTLRVRIAVNVRSGKQLVMIVAKSNQNAPINTFETIIADSRPLSSAASNSAPTLYSLAAAIPMAGMGGGWLAGSLASVNTALVEGFRTIYSSVGTSGSSAFMQYGVACRCIILEREKSYEPLDESVRQTIGLPVNKALLLSSLGNGFIQTINASVTISGFYNESLQINSMLNGGVYIE